MVSAFCSAHFTNTMTNFICFSSGSSGNCYYLQTDNFGLVIDLGIGIRHFKKYFRDYGLALARIGAIAVTHDHTDHVKAVGSLSTEFHLPVYSSKEVHAGMQRNHFMSKKVGKENVRHLPVHTPTEIGPFTVTMFPVPHDSAGNNGYFIETGTCRICLITDAGHVTPEMSQYIERATHVILEANYDKEMLEKGPYPMYLKRRITGQAGHLSNDDCAQTLASHLNPQARRVWLCHLSQENNAPELALRTVCDRLAETGMAIPERLEVEALKRTSPSPLYTLE